MNKISICGVAVISNLTVCDICVFHAAVFGEMKLFAVLCDLFKSSFDEATSCRRQVETKLGHYAGLGLGFGLRSCSMTAKSAPLALISANSAMVCLFCGKLFRHRSMTLSVEVKII